MEFPAQDSSCRQVERFSDLAQRVYSGAITGSIEGRLMPL